MKIKTMHPILGGTVSAIASKSQAHRLLIAAALSDSASQINCSETSDDIDATARCLNALGAQIDYANGIFSVSPIVRPVSGERKLNCGESGSTLRFILPICCALGAEASITMSGRLPQRPLSPLYEELISHGCALSPQGQNPLQVSGHLTGGRFTIPGNISSQYISGLLLALPNLSEDSIIKINGNIESKPYIDMTLSVLDIFGINVAFTEDCCRIKGGQRYNAPAALQVEGDWSNAAFWLCAGALTDEGVTVTNIDLSSLQGDKAVVNILERFGAHITHGENSVTVSRGSLRGIELDAGDTPDLVPVLAAVASVSAGKTVIKNASRLRIKESDRLATVTETLCALGAVVKETEDGLEIIGKALLDGGNVSAHGDHRIAMTAAVISSACRGTVTISGAEAVNKSYPGFFKDFSLLGGKTEEVM